jgi:hypothetical protein
MIANAEHAYAASGAGAHKRAAVLAAVQAFEVSLNAGAPTVAPEFESWMETVLSAYNAAAGMVDAPAAPAAATIFGDVEAMYDKAANVVRNDVVPVALTAAQLARGFNVNTNGI